MLGVETARLESENVVYVADEVAVMATTDGSMRYKASAYRWIAAQSADDRKGKVFQLGSSSDATIGKSFSNEGVLIKRLFICSVRLDFI